MNQSIAVLVISAVIGFALPITPTLADEVNVINATADCRDTACTFSATLQHADSGWDHYANHWRVVTTDGKELGRRVLLHPHEHEQPFTRSLRDVAVPLELDAVFIEAHDSVHGYGGQQFELLLNR